MISKEELEEIKRYKELHFMWMCDPKGFSAEQAIEYHALSEKWGPIDISAMLIRDVESLQSQLRESREDAEKYQNRLELIKSVTECI